MSSSSSSSLSSVSFSSSSSSFGAPKTRDLWSVLIEQEHHDLLPFSFTAESAVSDSSTLTFELETTTSPYFDYSVLIGEQSASPTTYESTAYVPKDDAGEVEHHNVFHTEIIAKDISGIKDYNVRMQEGIYGYETPQYTFNVPKFS